MIPDLPPWSGDNDAMYRWCEAMLQEQIERELTPPNGKLPTGEELWASEAFALGVARNGHLEPLRKLYPHLAEFLHPPSKHGKYKREIAPLKGAARDLVKRVKALWRTHYGKRKRGIYDIKAEEIVAEYLGVREQQVVRWVRRK